MNRPVVVHTAVACHEVLYAIIINDIPLHGVMRRIVGEIVGA